MNGVQVVDHCSTSSGTTVDITYADHSGLLVATGLGCGHDEWVRTGARPHDPPEAEDALIEQALTEIRTLIQCHAETCQMARPTT